jgi:hypothetical protein
VASLAAMGAAAAADADTIISAKVELLEEKQMVMRQLVAVDDSFVPPPDYKVRNACRMIRHALIVSGLSLSGQLQYHDYDLGHEELCCLPWILQPVLVLLLLMLA